MSLPPPPYLGAAYYPEDWPLEQVDADIALMREAGMTVMRIGEFAWARMEPEEGRYDFAWLHEVVDKLGRAGVATILGTPTCTPPVWLSERYPEIRVVRDGVGRLPHGGRRHACPNSPVYRDHCARIVTRMAEEFGADPNVIGWQIDNEVYPDYRRGCCCPVCHRAFQDRLRRRFGSAEALNAAWGLQEWSQAYPSFAQVPIPTDQHWHHPSLLTAWMEFQADSYIEFVHAQAVILHRLARQPVGTDMMPTNGVNHYRMTRALDVVQYNHYDPAERLPHAVFWMDYQRPLRPRPFWNTETATCWNGSTVANGYKEPGFCRVNSWLPIALGGEANLYWLWRAHWSGHELMHGSVVSSSGRPLHIFGEVRETAAGFRRAASFLNGTRPAPAGLALHFSSSAWWIFEWQAMVKGFRYLEAISTGYHLPLRQAHVPMDVIDPAAALDSYRVVCSPCLPALDDAGLRERLRAWIEGGGTWIAGPLTDIRTLEATKYRQAPFGSLEAWAGVHLTYEIPGDPRDFAVRWPDGRRSPGSLWYDGFELRGGEALATYEEGPCAGLAAVAQRRVGRGRIVLLGTLPRPEDLQRLVLPLAAERGIRPVAEASPNLLVVPREGPAGRGLVALELQHREATLTLPEPMTDLLTGRRTEGTLDLAPFSVAVLQAG
jgi:beta-galactosidase GanA